MTMPGTYRCRDAVVKPQVMVRSGLVARAAPTRTASQAPVPYAFGFTRDSTSGRSGAALRMFSVQQTQRTAGNRAAQRLVQRIEAASISRKPGNVPAHTAESLWVQREAPSPPGAMNNAKADAAAQEAQVSSDASTQAAELDSQGKAASAPLQSQSAAQSTALQGQAAAQGAQLGQQSATQGNALQNQAGAQGARLSGDSARTRPHCSRKRAAHRPICKVMSRPWRPPLGRPRRRPKAHWPPTPRACRTTLKRAPARCRANGAPSSRRPAVA